MAKILLVPFGSRGDVNPFIGLGIALQRRGHKPTVIANQYFETMCRAENLDFVATTSAHDYEAFFRNPNVWHPTRGIPVLVQHILAAVRPTFEQISQLSDRDDAVLICSPHAFGALLAKDKFHLKSASVLLNLTSLSSIHVPLKSPLLPWIPSWIEDRIYPLLLRLSERSLNRLFAPQINPYRIGLGLNSLSNMKDWINSPSLLLAAWPKWFYDKQSDWPVNATHVGFIEYDAPVELQKGEDIQPPQLERSPILSPIVFTAGTAMSHAADFFSAAVRACEALNRPGILLTQHPEQIPEITPSYIQHLSYAPLSDLLSKSAAIVHHGGIGTAARALKAGIPQLIVPMAFDQFANAHRLAQLGVAKSISRKRLSGKSMAALLNHLLESASIAKRCHHYQEMSLQMDATEAACNFIEQLCRTSHSFVHEHLSSPWVGNLQNDDE